MGQHTSEYQIPAERLPEGFRDTLGDPPDEPVRPRPAATVILLRESATAPEILLLKRNRSTGFVPGAYVFPGGRVDEADNSPACSERWSNLSREEADQRLELGPDAPVSGIAFYTAALREAFEETGLLLTQPFASAQASGSPFASGREALLEDRGSWSRFLEDHDLCMDGNRVEYVAHWVTPVVEPRRYDTRFFAAVVPEDARARIDPREMVDAVWLTAADALDRHRAGGLPMIFPTIRTLEDLSDFSSAGSLLAHYRETRIPVIMPEIVRTEAGVALRIHNAG
jgi:8-oxo-dGTP pyrophosphatase MutT (NUDIX family)